jgi:flagellar L-ring protein precursor FlgH
MISLSKLLRYGFLSAVSLILLAACASADRPSLLTTPTTARPRPIQETSANM